MVESMCRVRKDVLKMNRKGRKSREVQAVLQRKRASEVTMSKKRKSIYKDTERLAEAIDNYFEHHLADSGEVADIEGLAEYIHSTRDEFLVMLEDSKCGSILKQARNRIAKIKKQLAFNGKIPAAVLSFDLKNNHGYRDKPEESDSASTQEKVIFKGKASDWAQ